MSVQEITDNLETKEGLLNLISQMIKDHPNDTDLGRFIRNTLKDYLEKDQ